MGISVDAFQEAVERFTEHILREYVSRVHASKTEPPEKEINDAVWKTVIIKPLEVLILDSPLLQRLRYVKQLGVAHWIYPSRRTLA